MTIAVSAICFFPLDVANAGGAIGCNANGTGCDRIPFTFIWYTLFVIIVVLLCVVLPFVVFFYETMDIEQPPTGERCRSACSWTLGVIVVVAALTVIFCLLIKETDIGIESFTVSANNTFLIDMNPDDMLIRSCIFILLSLVSNWEDKIAAEDFLSPEEMTAAKLATGVQETLSIPVSIFIRTIAFFCIIGWLFFVIFAGIGIIGLPYKLI